MNWQALIESPEWREIIETIRARKATVLTELSQVETTPTMEKVRSLQAELKTCYWLESLPTIMIEEITANKGRQE